MKRESQLPFTFNNDRDVKAFRDFIKSASDTDIKFAMSALDHEHSRRQRVTFQDRTKEAMAGFLDKISFDYFCTFTTRRPVSLYATRRIAEKVCDRVQAGSTSSVFWCAEEFDVRDGFHFHALMKMPGHLKHTQYRDTLFHGREELKSQYQSFGKVDLFNWYHSRYGRCQIIDNREPDRQLAASHYVSKYVTKKITDYDFRICKSHLL